MDGDTVVGMIGMSAIRHKGQLQTIRHIWTGGSHTSDYNTIFACCM